jgi:hypothetical protein
MDAETRKRKIAEHLEAIRELEETATEASGRAWPPDRYYLLWNVVVGLMLGTLASVVSLLANTVGAPLFGRRPLELIRVYLTFPMGESALAVDDGVLLFVGCLLYLVTGAVYGLLIHLTMSWYFSGAPLKKRLQVATALGLALWVVNFYLVLSWLQPLLLGGSWILSEVPPWVAALTHLAFAWTVVLGETWGRFEPFGKGAAEGEGERAHA